MTSTIKISILFDFSPGHPQQIDWVVDRGAAVAPASASVASPARPSDASAPVAQMVVVVVLLLLKPPKVDLKMNLSHMSVVWSEENVCVFCDVRSFVFL